MFVRIKKVKEKEYAYLVENIWTSKGSRQKVKDYLGKIKRLQKIKDEQKEIKKEYKESIKELIKKELINHGFKESGSELIFEEIKANINDLTIKENSRKVVLAMNEGFMCETTLKRLMSFILQGEEKEAGTKLANLLTEAGTKLNDEEFIKLYNTITKNEEQPEEEQKEEEFYY